jgi:hypothetical protein
MPNLVVTPIPRIIKVHPSNPSICSHDCHYKPKHPPGGAKNAQAFCLWWSEDFDLSIHLQPAGKMVHEAELIPHYRRHSLCSSCRTTDDMKRLYAPKEEVGDA